MVNAAFAGRVYPPTPVYEVGREKIREFAEAIGGGDPGAFVDLPLEPLVGPQHVHPAHIDPAAARALGYPDVIAPPTFAVIVAQRCDAQLVRDPEAGIDFTRVVHGEQTFTHHRPIVAGDRLVAVLHVDSVRSAGGHSMVTTRSEITTEAGEPVCTATSTIVVRGEDA
jgi:acyl dehydratase